MAPIIFTIHAARTNCPGSHTIIAARARTHVALCTLASCGIRRVSCGAMRQGVCLLIQVQEVLGIESRRHNF